MQWNNLADFLAMGGYGSFVWSAYGLTAAILAAMTAAGLKRLGDARRELAAAEKVDLAGDL
jgi:heme exporter protein D